MSKEDTDALFHDAVRLFRNDSLQDAEILLSRILEATPDFAEASYLSGVIAARTGDYELAEHRLAHAISIKPDEPVFRFNHGTVLQARGRLDAALAELNKAISLTGCYAEAFNARGDILRDLGNIRDAQESYEAAVRCKPDYAEAHNNIGCMLWELGRGEESLGAFDAAIRYAPGFHVAYNNRGNVLRKLGRTDEAVDSYVTATRLFPGYTSAYCNLGSILLDLKRSKEALAAYTSAAGHEPGSVEAHYGRGNALWDLEKLEEAVGEYQRTVQLQPAHARAWNNLGSVLWKLGRLEEAVSATRKAIRILPEYSAAHSDLGLVLKDLGRIDEATRECDEAIRLDPENAEAHVYQATNLLLSGKLESGWKEYAWRWCYDRFPSRKRDFPIPEWNGEPLEEKTVLVTAEQGIGDEIMFASCVQDLEKQAGKVILECDSRLESLFRRSFPAVITRGGKQTDDPGWLADLPECDYRVSIGTLPEFFRPSMDSFPEAAAYLFPDDSLVAKWKARLAETGRGLKVGISWRGGADAMARSRRTIPLAMWRPLAAIDGVVPVNLQYDYRRHELDEAGSLAGIRVRTWDDIDLLNDLDDLAALIASLDLVVTIDNATVHMAGALGCRTILLLPFSHDWRWFIGFENSLWYRNVRLVRQESPGGWDGVFSRLHEILVKS